MPNPQPTYLEELMVIETMPMSKAQKKKIAEMKKVLSKGNVLSPEQKKELESLMANIEVPEGFGMDKVGLAMNMKRNAEVPEGFGMDKVGVAMNMKRNAEVPEGFGMDKVGYGMNTDKPKSSERYNREAKKGEASEADFNQKMDADRQVGMKNVFDLDKEDRAAAAAMLRTAAPVVR